MLSVELISRCSCYVFRLIFRCETSTMSARQFRHFVQTTKTTQPRPQVSSTPLITTITVIVSLGVLIFLIATCVKLCCRPEKTNSSRNSLTTIRRYNNRAGTGFPTFSITTALPTRRLWSAWIWTASYYPQTIEGYEPPPPYSAEFQGESGGEHTKI